MALSRNYYQNIARGIIKYFVEVFSVTDIHFLTRGVVKDLARGVNIDPNRDY